MEWVFWKAINSDDSDATDSADDAVTRTNVGVPSQNGKNGNNVKELKVAMGPMARGHSYSHSVGAIEDIVAVQGVHTVHTHSLGSSNGMHSTETPKNLCSPQTADQWDDDALDRQAEAIRMQLEQYRMDRE